MNKINLIEQSTLRKRNLRFLFLFNLFLLFSCSVYSQTGIGTITPDPSAILDLNSLNKGFKGPNVPLINRFDQSTIPNPATGLLVFNTQNSGVSPDEVYANSYYYWNGTEWYHIPTTRIFEDISVPGVFVLNSNDTQTIGNINNGEHRAISFPNPQIINAGNIATLTNNETITILESGLYEVTAFVQYNPSQTADERRALLNTYIEKRDGGSGNWQLIAGGRTSWGRNTTHYLQTAQIPVTVVRLNAGDQIRFTIANKITSGTRSSHGNPSVVSTSVNNPVSKSLRLYLIGF